MAYQLLLKLYLAQNSPVYHNLKIACQPSDHFTKARPICSTGLIWMLWISGWAGVMSCLITWTSRIEFRMLKRSHARPVFHLPLWPSAGRFYRLLHTVLINWRSPFHIVCTHVLIFISLFEYFTQKSFIIYSCYCHSFRPVLFSFL